MKRLLLGTHNPARLAILRAALAGLPLEILDLLTLGISSDALEVSVSTRDNAVAKARFYFTLSGIPTLSSDGGLRMDRFPLEKQPGVTIRRIGKASRAGRADPEEILAYYIRELEKVGGASLGTWTGSVALMASPDKLFTGAFSFVTLFTTHRQGVASPGLDLDPIMVDPATGKSYTELSIAEHPSFDWYRKFVCQHLDHIQSSDGAA
jgi:inosine/xanthosine triphosphate pyrophosphatase family protein